jgi:hypothetical protein
MYQRNELDVLSQSALVESSLDKSTRRMVHGLRLFLLDSINLPKGFRWFRFALSRKSISRSLETDCYRL